VLVISTAETHYEPMCPAGAYKRQPAKHHDPSCKLEHLRFGYVYVHAAVGETARRGDGLVLDCFPQHSDGLWMMTTISKARCTDIHFFARQHQSMYAE
jgi:hypothetical protein